MCFGRLINSALGSCGDASADASRHATTGASSRRIEQLFLSPKHTGSPKRVRGGCCSDGQPELAASSSRHLVSHNKCFDEVRRRESNPRPHGAVTRRVALNPSTVVDRRTALAGLVAAPAAAGAVNNPLDPESFSGYKERNYGGDGDEHPGDGEEGATPPDGFGGYIERDEDVKPVINRILGDGGDLLRRQMWRRRPKRLWGVAVVVGLVKGASVDEMVQNSIASREQLIGRELTADEKKALADKVKSMLGV